MRACLFVVLGLGCGASSRRLPPEGDADADADTDADTDVDSDSDSDTDTGSDPGGDGFRPLEVCGLGEIQAGRRTPMRVLAWGCDVYSCTVEASRDRVDLRPTARPSELDIDCSPGPVWVECDVPDVADVEVEVTVWGEPIGTIPTCIDLEGGGPCPDLPDCFQLPPVPLGDCEPTPLRATRACFPRLAPAHADATVTASDGCGCPADWIPAGAWVTETAEGPTFEVLVARCGDCGMEAVCQEVEGVAHLYDRWPGEETVRVQNGFGFSRTISFEEDVEEGGRICQEATF